MLSLISNNIRVPTGRVWIDNRRYYAKHFVGWNELVKVLSLTFLFRKSIEQRQTSFEMSIRDRDVKVTTRLCRRRRQRHVKTVIIAHLIIYCGFRLRFIDNARRRICLRGAEYDITIILPGWLPTGRRVAVTEYYTGTSMFRKLYSFPTTCSWGKFRCKVSRRMQIARR